jgi:hypothetical protein
MKLRLKALEAKMAEENLVLTEAQLQALERAKQEKEAHGEIETHHPGYLGSQDTFYVGTIKGVCIYRCHRRHQAIAHIVPSPFVESVQERRTPGGRKWRNNGLLTGRNCADC